MDRWQNRVAVVTGASSGIGAAIVKQLVEAGFIVVGMARRKERVEELRANLPADLQSRVHAVRCDVADVKSVNDSFDWVIEQLGGVDVLVNNAGTHTCGQILTQEVSKLQEMVQTNVMGVVYCTQRAFRSMKERSFDGHIVMLNSILGHGVISTPPGVLPVATIYPSTKYAVTAMTEVMRQELNAFGTKIKITSISPGVVGTDILPEQFREQVQLKPEDIAAGVLYAISTPPTVQVHELTIKPVGELF